MKRAKLAAAAIGATLLLAMPAGAAAAETDAVREAQDRAQIAELMWNYVRAIDTWNEDAYPLVFTPDGAFGPAKGRDALRKMVVDFEKERAERKAKGQAVPDLHHIMTNEHVEFTGRDSARLHYYWMTVTAGSPGTPPPQVLAAGRGVDDLVRADGRWLIRNRNVTPKD